VGIATHSLSCDIVCRSAYVRVGEDLWVVEFVRAKRVAKDGASYLVRWLGYSAKCVPSSSVNLRAVLCFLYILPRAILSFFSPCCVSSDLLRVSSCIELLNNAQIRSVGA